MSDLNKIITKHRRSICESLDELAQPPYDGRSRDVILESALYAFAEDIRNIDFERGSELLKSIQKTMLKR